jgi:hypothetical protein
MTDKHQDTTFKLRLPDACRSITLDGKALPIEPDGSLETDGATAAALAAHGAVPWQEDVSSDDIATLSREKLVDLFLARTLDALKAQETETIRSSLLEVEADDAPSPPVTRDMIAKMTRTSVLVFLRDRDVAMPTGASLAELRARAVETLDA